MRVVVALCGALLGLGATDALSFSGQLRPRTSMAPRTAAAKSGAPATRQSTHMVFGRLAAGVERLGGLRASAAVVAGGEAVKDVASSLAGEVACEPAVVAKQAKGLAALTASVVAMLQRKPLFAVATALFVAIASQRAGMALAKWQLERRDAGKVAGAGSEISEWSRFSQQPGAR